MKNALSTAGLVLLALLGGMAVLQLLLAAPPQPGLYGGAYVAGYWMGKLVFLTLGAWAGWRLLVRESTPAGGAPKTFTPGAQPAPRTFTPGSAQALGSDGRPELVAPDVRAFFLGRR